MDTVLEAEHTHFYPGHEGWLEAGSAVETHSNSVPCKILFADGVVTSGDLSLCGSSGALGVDAYTTAAGSDISAKRWQLRIRRADDGRIRFRIQKKLVRS